MALGVVSGTIGADVVDDPTTSIGLAVVGFVGAAAGGIWRFRLEEKRGGYDERYLQIGLRGGAVAGWTFYWG